jgi:hypothetical protein
MTVIRVQVGKNIVEDVLIKGGASVNIIIENLKTKLGLPKLEDSHTWYSIYSHIYYFEK